MDALDANIKIFSQGGIGHHTEIAEIPSYDEEELLRNSSRLDSETPTQLLNTLVYLNGLHFAIRGGDEHRPLKIN